jgi:hypothetical protein
VGPVPLVRYLNKSHREIGFRSNRGLFIFLQILQVNSLNQKFKTKILKKIARAGSGRSGPIQRRLAQVTRAPWAGKCLATLTVLARCQWSRRPNRYGATRAVRLSRNQRPWVIFFHRLGGWGGNPSRGRRGSGAHLGGLPDDKEVTGRCGARRRTRRWSTSAI